MKKSLVLMAMAGVALAGCVNDVAEVAQNQEQKKVKIAFESPVLYNNAESRANYYGEIGSHTYTGSSTVYTYPREENFQIYAVTHTGDLGNWEDADSHEMNDKSISYDQSVDGWAPKTDENHYYYWPEGKMSFAASSPADLEHAANREYGNTGLTIENFVINTDASKHYDLLYSDRAANKTKDNMQHGADYYSGIPIEFYHALSSIRFSIQNETEALVVLKEIRLGGVKFKGDFAQNLGTGNPAEWTVIDEFNTTDPLDETEDGYKGFEGAVIFLAEAQYVASLAATDNDADGITDKTNQLLLLPQELTPSAQLYVGYTVNGTPHSKIANIYNLEDLGGNKVNKWEMGKRYTYRIVYTSLTAKQDKIFFSPSTEGWVNHDVVVVNL